MLKSERYVSTNLRHGLNVLHEGSLRGEGGSAGPKVPITTTVFFLPSCALLVGNVYICCLLLTQAE